MESQATLALLIDQWSDKPKLKSVIQIWLDIHKEQIRDAITDLQDMARVDTAAGVWLDYIGVRLGINRPSVDSTTTLTEEAILAFGFSSLDGTSKSGLGFEQAPFDYSRSEVSRSFLDERVQLGDASYRRLIKARGWYVQSQGTLFYLRNAVQEIDPEAGVLDNRDMTITITTGLSDLMRIAIEIECLPFPAGVKPIIVDTNRPSVPAGVTVSKSTISLFEGRSTTYTLVLDSPPATGETVTITPTSSDTNHVTVSGGPVEFDGDDWNIPQVITVEAVTDGNSRDESETISNTLTTDGTRYADVTPADIAVTVDDTTVSATDPVISIAAYLDATSITEGTTAEWVITADIAPMADITIGLTVSQSGAFVAAADIGTDKEVTLQMGETSVRYTVDTIDDDTEEADGSVTVALNAGTGYAVDSSSDSVEIAIVDDDETSSFEISVTAISVSVQEGTNVQFRISSDRAVNENLTVPYTITQDGDFIAAGALGMKSAIIADTFQTVDVTIATIDDDTIESAGSVTITLDTPAGDANYTLSSTNSTASTAVTSEDTSSAIVLPVPTNLRNRLEAGRLTNTQTYLFPQWDAVEGAAEYELRVGNSFTEDDSAVTVIEGETTTVQATRVTWLVDVGTHEDLRYIWFSVRAKSNNQQIATDSPWSGWIFSYFHRN